MFIIEVSCPKCWGVQRTIQMLNKTCDFCHRKFPIDHNSSSLIYGNSKWYDYVLKRYNTKCHPKNHFKLTPIEQTKFCLSVIAKDFHLGDIHEEIKLAEKENLYEMGMKPSKLAAGLIIKFHPEAKILLKETKNIYLADIDNTIEFIDKYGQKVKT